MIIRIVKLTLLPEKINDFVDVFNESNETIKQFEGCLSAILVKDMHQENVVFTISEWTDEAALNAYRASAFFEGVWTKAKATFAEKASAWSVERIA
jgi:quinol monooxygenase YgiN